MSGNGLAKETEVSSKARRRSFTAEYKRRILLEVDACDGRDGGIGAILRREGLYSSHLTEWRVARERGELAALEPKQRGPKGRVSDERDDRIAELERQIKKLEARAERAETLVDIQKKVASLLGIPLPDSDGKR